MSAFFDKYQLSGCSCGRDHSFSAEIYAYEGAIREIEGVLKRWDAKKVFLLADRNTYAAAGDKVSAVVEESGVAFTKFVFEGEGVEPDETHVGLALLHFDPSADAVISVGSGVINDIGKILSATTGKPYIIVGTAPSMDGYASATSSMTRAGHKVSLNSKCPDVIIGDVDVLKEAPLRLLASGVGDMLAKYVSICEWRIAHIVTGEYYCERVADLVRTALRKCVDNADGLLKRDPVAVAAVFEGLVIGGAAMKFAGLSRPASGVEHYFSHVWDMRAAAFGTPAALHGEQCAVGTLIAAELYEKLLTATPDREKAVAYVKKFDFAAWSDTLRAFLGKGADTMIAAEARDKKYDPALHRTRLDVILSRWAEITAIVKEEVPTAAFVKTLMEKLGLPLTMDDIGVGEDIKTVTFAATKDIRDKYVLSRLCFDLGIIDEIL